MTFEDLSKQLNTSVQSIPNLVQVLSAAFAEMEGGGSGSSHEYSTEEHAIGKWTDGKTIYEKVISYTFASGQYTHVPFNSAVDKLIDISIVPIGCSSYYTNSGDYLRAYRYRYESNDGIMFERGGTGNVSGDAIIRYTK